MTNAIGDALRALWSEGRSVYRCNGTPEEVSDYAAGGGDGWNIPNHRRPVVGDLLVGVAAGRAKRATVCRQRSRELREAALARYEPRCFVCEFRPHDAFGDLGSRALDCHHLDPIATWQGRRKTPTDDVRILCAVCHRLAHTYPIPDLTVLETVRGWWLEGRAAGVLVGPMRG